MRLFVNQINHLKAMGGCCCDLFEKNEILNNESRLKMLQTKIKTENHTQNDGHFTYYLHHFDQHQYLEKVLQGYKEVFEKTEDSSAYPFDSHRMEQELKQLSQYLLDCENKQSSLHARMAKDSQIIKHESRIYPNIKDNNQLCMIKLEIQGFQLIQGVTRFIITKSVKLGEKEYKNEEFVLLNRTKNDKIYRELIFPAIKTAKIQIKTEPIISTVTIDIQDIMKEETVCDVFRFQRNDEDFGFIALRIQFFTQNSQYIALRREKLMVLQKELKVCLARKSGFMNSSASDSSHKNTFISDYVSEYHNQYQV